MRALVVDDSLINIKVATRLLTNIGLEVDYVLSGKECLNQINNYNYDIIFMDIMMPEMNGVETFHKLQEIEGFNIPVIALTADVDNDAEARYLKEGFNDYIPKPINFEKLKNIANSINKNN